MSILLGPLIEGLCESIFLKTVLLDLHADFVVMQIVAQLNLLLF
jgi:hypothetical protein